MNFNDFLNKEKPIAIIGVSENKEKWGWRTFEKLKSNGFNVFAINPKYSEVNGFPCFKNLKELPVKPETIITIVPPKITEQVVKQAIELKINKIWMQPGSESIKAIKDCEDNNIQVIHNACFVVDGLKQKW